MLAISRPTPPTQPVRNLRVRASRHFRAVPLVFVTACLVVGAGGRAHPTDIPVDVQMQGFLESLPSGVQRRTRFAFEDPERFRFGWTPGRREGVRLDELDAGQRQLLEDFLRSVLSEAGARKVDAIIATEAALGVIENAPDYRNPGKYYRIAGRRLLIEHDNRSGGTHVHAAWRDVETDFGAAALAE